MQNPFVDWDSGVAAKEESFAGSVFKLLRACFSKSCS